MLELVDWEKVAPSAPSTPPISQHNYIYTHTRTSTPSTPPYSHSTTTITTHTPAPTRWLTGRRMAPSTPDTRFSQHKTNYTTHTHAHPRTHAHTRTHTAHAYIHTPAPLIAERVLGSDVQNVVWDAIDKKDANAPRSHSWLHRPSGWLSPWRYVPTCTHTCTHAQTQLQTRLQTRSSTVYPSSSVLLACLSCVCSHIHTSPHLCPPSYPVCIFACLRPSICPVYPVLSCLYSCVCFPLRALRGLSCL